MGNYDFKSEDVRDSREELYSTKVRAGKRTYFFDAKETINKDPYIVITESKRTVENGRLQFDKHKIYLYKEDLVSFTQGLSDVTSYIKNNYPELFNEDGTVIDTYAANKRADIDAEFESL